MKEAVARPAKGVLHSTLHIIPLRIPGTFQINPEPRFDERGYFMRIWDEEIAKNHGLTTRWVQENQSHNTQKHVIRGLHFQLPPYAETKLVRVVHGAILDVFVDLRKESETFGEWDAIELSADNQQLVYIPNGVAHGFCTLTEESTAIYKVDTFYAPQHEGGIRWDDETLKIDWPTTTPILSPKDQTLGTFEEFHSPFSLGQ